MSPYEVMLQLSVKSGHRNKKKSKVNGNSCKLEQTFRGNSPFEGG